MKKNVQRQAGKEPLSASGFWLLGSGFSGEAITRMEKLVGADWKFAEQGRGLVTLETGSNQQKSRITTSVANGTTSNSRFLCCTMKALRPRSSDGFMVAWLHG